MIWTMIHKKHHKCTVFCLVGYYYNICLDFHGVIFVVLKDFLVYIFKMSSALFWLFTFFPQFSPKFWWNRMDLLPINHINFNVVTNKKLYFNLLPWILLQNYLYYKAKSLKWFTVQILIQKIRSITSVVILPNKIITYFRSRSA